MRGLDLAPFLAPIRAYTAARNGPCARYSPAARRFLNRVRRFDSSRGHQRCLTKTAGQEADERLLATGIVPDEGTQNSTVVPSPGALSSLHHPPASSARSSIETSPRRPGASTGTSLGENPSPSSADQKGQRILPVGHSHGGRSVLRKGAGRDRDLLRSQARRASEELGKWAYGLQLMKVPHPRHWEALRELGASPRP